MTSPAAARTALVTGASTGIGRASALALHAAGLTVIAAMRTPDRTGLPDGVRVVELDVDDDASVAAAFEAAGPVDVLVNNAGTSPTGATEDFPSRHGTRCSRRTSSAPCAAPGRCSPMCAPSAG